MGRCNGMKIPEMSIMENIDYTTFTLEHSLDILYTVQEYVMETMYVELEFVRSCMESGFITLLEAQQKEGVYEKIKRMVREFIERIKTLFNTRTKEKCEKYQPWVLNMKTEFAKMAKNCNPINISPYWKGKYNEDCNTIISCMNKAFNNVIDNKIDYSFAKPLLKDPNIIAESSNDVTEYLKNYFRFNLLSTTEIKQVRLTGGEIADMVDDISNYILKYGDVVPKNFDKVQAALNRNLDRVREPSSVKESVSPNTFLMVEGKPVSETILTTMINYQAICENKKRDEQVKTKIVTPDGKTTAGDSDKEVNVGDVTSEESSGDNDANKGDKSQNTNNSDLVEYYKNIVKFFETCITAYTTACEERYTTYTKLLIEVASHNNRRPKFDKDGNVSDETNDSDNVSIKNDSKSESNNKKRSIRNRLRDAKGHKK